MAELFDILESGTLEHLVFKPDTHAGHLTPEGTLWYSSVDHTLAFRNDITGTNLNIGEESFIRVINNTGSPIPACRAVRHNGVDVLAGRPQIIMALADTFEHATLLGVTAHEILDGEEGFVLSEGTLRLCDTSLLPSGTPLYLSDTVPGTFGETPPSIVTQVGGVLVSDAVEGKLQVNIVNTKDLPDILGFLQGVVFPTRALNTSPLEITDYSSEESILMPTNTTTGVINTLSGGAFRINFSWSGSTTIDQRTIFWEVYDKTNTTILYTYYHAFNKDLTAGQISASFSFPFRVSSATDIVIRARSSDTLSIDIDYISFDLESVKLG